MNILAAVLVALRGLQANKLRSSLTILGVLIGVAAVVSLMSIGQGVQASINQSISSLGTNLIYVRPGSTVESGVRTAQGSAVTLTMEDAAALADPVSAPAVALVSPQQNTFGQLIAGGQNTAAQVYGVTPEFQDISRMEMADGEFISERDILAKSRVLVLGSTVATTLFPDASPVGQSIRVNNQPFKVVGVLKSKGGTGFGSQDEMVIAPITTVQTRLSRGRTASGASSVQVINVQATSDKDVEAAKEQIATILRERHRIVGDDDFTVTSLQDLLQAISQVTLVLTVFLGSIAGISLLVGGIGIMNIMLVSVTERTREIGIRKAVGAKRNDILLQFLVEATTLSLVGGVIGLLFGWGVSRLIGRIPMGGQTIPAVVTPEVALLALSVSVVVGLFFGIYPAGRAAQLNPIEALRYE